MPSNSLAALPPTANPTALFAQTALPQQILTPLFSFTSTLLPRSLRGSLHSFLPRANSARGPQTARSVALFRSLSKEQKSSLLFSTPCALFAENAGVYPPSHSPISIFHFPFSQHPMKDADPERPSGAEGFLNSLRPARIFAKPIRINTYKIILCKFFRMNTYEKTREGGRGRSPAAISAQPFSGSMLPRLKPAASRTSHRATPAAHPSAHSTAGSDPSSYAPCDARAIPTPRASGTRRCHPPRGANRIAGSLLPSASAPPGQIGRAHV